jgi:DNA-binding NarL/FixJ family response regulator
MDILMHRGIPHDGPIPHSGRFPYGSGEDSFYSQYRQMHKDGLTDGEIADKLGMTLLELRARRSYAKELETQHRIIEVRRMHEHGESNTYIASKLGVTEGTVRNIVKNLNEEKMGKNQETMNILKANLEKTGYLDVSSGTELELTGCTKERMKTAVQMLKDEGYTVENIYVKQATNPENSTTVKVLAKPGTSLNDIYKNMDQISIINQTTFDNGETWVDIKDPETLSSDRIQIIYGDQGGKLKDGVIELRRGVPDISLGKANYAQVRIKVDDDLYIKGMAMYADDLPDGVDVRVNSNKKTGTPLADVLKPMKRDEEGNVDTSCEGFGALIKAGGQVYYDDPNGKYINPETGNKANISVVNKLREEGDWDLYSKNLASQFLSKQPQSLIKQQLDISLNEKQLEFKEIQAIELPELRKKYLESFADDCDASAVHLKAAALPRQSSKVLLPMEFLKDTECYAPAYNNGEQLALVRYPHQGVWEIPVVTVNNNNPRAKDILPKTSLDAIGINLSVANQLSGADFDGDTVIAIPVNNGKTRIRSSQDVNIKDGPLAALRTFDPSEAFPGYPGMHIMDGGATSGPEKAVEMGKISNLITDMTFQGASEEELARATKHAQVVIDAPKHKLDWKASERENGILALKKKYQGGETKGAATLISKAKGIAYDDERKRGKYWNPNTNEWFEGDPTKEEKKRLGLRYLEIDPDTGEKLYRYTGRTFRKALKEKHIQKDEFGNDVLDKEGNPKKVMSFILDEETGKRVYGTKEYTAQTKLTKMAKAKDAYELSSGHPIENMYADYANSLKQMANEARKLYLNTETTKINKEAKEKYSAEVSSLNSKLKIAQLNAPRERKAQLEAAAKVQKLKEKHREINEYDKDSMDKLAKRAQRYLSEARAKYGANKSYIIKNVMVINDKEWEAIRAGAIPSSTITAIINNTDNDKLRQLATPSNNKELNSTRKAYMKQLSDRGYSLSEIADKMGVSPSTVATVVKE